MKRNGNVVLVTGGGTGIGLALAAKLLREGNEVIICGRTTSSLEEARRHYPGLAILVADVSSEDGRKKIVEVIQRDFPKLNVLINNAGVSFVTSIKQPDFISKLESEVAVNLVAPLALAHALLPLLEQQPQATVINVTSGYAYLPSSRMSGYSASKAGLRAATSALRFQLRNTNVRVVEVAPPSVDTAMARGLPGMTPALFAEKVFSKLVKGKNEIVIGASRLAKLLSRLSPQLGVKIMNDGEERNPAYVKA